MRREVALPVADTEALNAAGLAWETAAASGSNWLFISGWRLPRGYSAAQATLGIRLAAYPHGVLDMAYFNPPIARQDAKPIVGLSLTLIDGRTFQQWSRHYPWIQGVDSLARHLRRIDGWLRRELGKR